MNTNTIYIIEFVIAGIFAKYIYSDEEFRLNLGRILKNIYSVLGTLTSMYCINSMLGSAFQIQDKVVLCALMVFTTWIILYQIKHEDSELHYAKIELKALKKINRESKQARTGALIESVEERQASATPPIPTKQPTDFGVPE